MKHEKINDEFTSYFFEGRPVIKQLSEESDIYIRLKDIADMVTEAVYVLDFQKRCFHYVGDNDLFLCGHSSDEAMKSGYEFFKEVIHPDDLSLWVKIHVAILNLLYKKNWSFEEMNYFSFNFRYLNSFQAKEKKSYLMVYHRLKPVWLNGVVRFGICFLSSSVIPESGNLALLYKNGLECDNCVIKSKKWTRQNVLKLTKKQMEILALAKQGKQSKEIADVLCVTLKTILNQEAVIYESLSVHSMIEAIIFASNRRMIFSQKTLPLHQPKIPYNKPLHHKKNRRPLTDETILRIQQRLDNGQSVNSIAKMEGVYESTVRYAIQTGKLKRYKETDSQKTIKNLRK
jgi:DNA-binding NarL/FixJ family response regulator